MPTSEDKTGGRRRRVIVDPRFIFGIVLMAGSTAGVLWLVSSADQTTTMLAADSTLMPGDRVTATDLVVVDVRMPVVEDHYLQPGDLPADGAVVIRVVDEGELVPASAIGAAANENSTSMVVALSGRLPESVGRGAEVDLWASPATDDRRFGPPAVLVPSALVVRIVEDDGFVVDRSASAVEILVPESRVPRVLEAIANADALALVPVAVSAGN